MNIWRSNNSQIKSKETTLKKRSINALLLISVGIIISSLFCACVQKIKPEIVQGIYDSLAALSSKAANDINAEITILNQSLKDAEFKLKKLEEVGNRAMQWIETTKLTADAELWNPRAVQVTTGLINYKNDRYEIVKLEFTVEPSSTRKYAWIITVFDVYTSKQVSYDNIHSDLKTEVTELNKRVQAKTEALKRSTTTSAAMLAERQTWKIAMINNSTYSVSGGLLGWSGSILAPGIWTYTIENKAIAPSDAGSQALEYVLKGK